MITFLDLLVIVCMALITAGALSVALMFLVKNQKVQRVCFYITVALSVYIGTVGVRINWPDFFDQAVCAVVMALVAVGSLVLERVRKNDDKMFLIARIAAAASLIIGIINALMI